MDETLISKVATSTGLSAERVQSILNEWVLETGRSPQDLSLEDFREVLVQIVQRLFADVAEGKNQFIQVSR